MIYDFAIFGGGVVGCSILNKLTRLNKKVILLEKQLDVATGQSKANSGLVHAGFDAKENTLKAKLNVRGNQLFESLCNQLSVPLKQTGAVVASTHLDPLKKLYERGLKNNVEGLEIIKSERLHELVPNLKANYKYGLFAKTAKIVSPYMFTIALAEEAVINGAKVLLGFNTIKIDKKKYCYTIHSNNSFVKAKKIINCAGVGVNEISKLLSVEEFDLKFRKGEYFVLDNTASDFVNLSVFPTPTNLGKGILATPTIDGNILFGPNNVEENNYSTATTKEGLLEIKKCINEMYHNVPWNKVIHNYTGVRVCAGDDFIIKTSEVDSNITLIAGINSPGLSSSPAIAEMVANILGLNCEEKNMKRRIPYKPLEFDINKRNEYITKNSSWGKIICKCEMVSEAEVINAIKSPLKPMTFDSIKRRVRTGMGRCQSGFCMLKVVKLLAKEYGLDLKDIKKEEKHSNIMIKDFEYDV